MAQMTLEANEKGIERAGGTSSNGVEPAPVALPGQDDIAMAIVGLHSQDIDPVIEARVIRKIDLFLIPAMIVGYGMVYYDKVRHSSLAPIP